MPNSDATERISWYEVVRKYLEQNDIPWTTWDYKGGFGLFEANSNEIFNYDMNVPLLEALNFSIPLQWDFSVQPARTGFTLYDDYAGEGIVTSSSGGSAALDFYNSNAQVGDHAIHWGGAVQYETVSFDFQPNVDLSLMPDNDYQLSFWVRGNSPQASFDIRFVDTKTGTTDHPWRMGKTIKDDIVPLNGEWQEVIIPFNELEEKGSWDDGWYEPAGKFQWSAVDRFEIVAEAGPLTGVDFFFDEIKVAGEEITIVLDAETRSEVKSLEVYPNPLRQQSIIEFATTIIGEVNVCIYDNYGQQLRQIFRGSMLPGSHSFSWDGENSKGQRVAAGLYLVRVTTEGKSTSGRLMVVY